MSFGFSVGDFLAVIKLAHKIRSDFNGAPDQFKEIALEVRTLSIVLQDASVNAAQFSDDQADNFQAVLSSCHALLQKLEQLVDKWSDVLQPKKGKTVQRLWKRLKWEPEEIRDLRSQLTSRVTLLNTFNDRTTSHNVAKLVRRNDDERQAKLLEWLSPVDYVAQQNYLVGRRQAGSRRWLFDSANFTQWLAQKGQILYCPGDPGTGKTFTTAMVIEKLQDETQNDSRILNTYLYCSYKNADQDAHSLLCSLLRNSFQQAGIPDTVFSLYEKRQALGQPLLHDEVLPLLGSLYTTFDRVNLLVDALDELPVQVRRPFITELLRMKQSQSLNLSLFLTSRNIPEIQRPFDDQGAAILEIRASDEDVRQFLMDSLFQLPGFVGRSPALQAEIIQAITEACSGMFLLAELHLGSLKHKKSIKALRSALSSLRVGSDAYDNAYEDTMARISALGPDSENLAKQAFLILSCARQPLLTEDLAYALSVEPDSETIDDDNVPDIEDVVAVCAGLVVIDKESNIVQLVHKSTQEYFERNRTRWFPRASDTMARLCIQYKSMVFPTMPHGTNTTATLPPFWRYADANVFYHALAAENETQAEEQAVSALPETGALTNVSSISELTLSQVVKEMGGSLDSILLSACRDGRHALVELLLKVNNYELSRSTSYSASKASRKSLRRHLNASRDDVLLTVAARRMDLAMVKILLDHGADPNVMNPSGQTALYIAASQGSETLIALLLEHPSIDLNCECADVPWFPASRNDNEWDKDTLWTPLLATAAKGHLGSIRLLLNRADRRYRDHNGMNAVCLAAAAGHCEIINELLKWSDIEHEPSSNQEHRSALEMAIATLNYRACEILMPLSDVNRQYANGNKPLHQAIEMGDIMLVHKLLAREDIDACAINAHGYKPVEFAAERGEFEILFALVRHIGARGIHDGNWASTQSALMDGCRDATDFYRLLSIPMLDINMRDAYGSAFLHRRGVYNDISILERALQQPTIDINIRDGDGNTPLMCSTQFCNYKAVEALLQHDGILVDAENQAGDTALFMTFSLKWLHRDPDAIHKIFERLLRHSDVRKNHRNKANQTILTLATQYGSISMLQSIIEVSDLSGQFHEIFPNGRTLVSFAAEFNTPDTFRFIFEKSLPQFIDLADSQGRTPLSYAAESGNYNTLRRLIEIGNVRVELPDHQGYTPLAYATKARHKKIKIWLMMKGEKKASNKRKTTEPLPIRSAKRVNEALE